MLKGAKCVDGNTEQGCGSQDRWQKGGTNLLLNSQGRLQKSFVSTDVCKTQKEGLSGKVKKTQRFSY